MLSVLAAVRWIIDRTNLAKYLMHQRRYDDTVHSVFQFLSVDGKTSSTCRISFCRIFASRRAKMIIIAFNWIVVWQSRFASFFFFLYLIFSLFLSPSLVSLLSFCERMDFLRPSLSEHLRLGFRAPAYVRYNGRKMYYTDAPGFSRRYARGERATYAKLYGGFLIYRSWPLQLRYSN